MVPLGSGTDAHYLDAQAAHLELPLNSIFVTMISNQLLSHVFRFVSVKSDLFVNIDT